MADALKNAMEMRAKLKADLARVEEFIAMHRKLCGDNYVPEMRRRNTVNGRPRAVLAEVIAVLTDSEYPMTAEEIIEACEARGLTMPGVKKQPYLSTLLWRNQDKIKKDKQYYYLIRDDINQEAA